MDFFIREGKSSDMTSVFILIEELVKIKKHEERLSLTVYDLINDCFSKNNKFDLLVAEKNNEIVGFALYYKTYSIAGESLTLEDVFVTKEHKKIGIGISLFAKFLDIAKKSEVAQSEWSLLKQFKNLILLYEESGAKIIWDSEIYRVNKDKMNLFLEQQVKNKIASPFKNAIVRQGEARDMLSVIEFFKKIALETDTICNLDLYDLIKDGFSNKPLFKTIVLEVEEEIVGMLLFFYSYGTFEGKSIIYEKLYIEEKFINHGFEEKMTAELFSYALKNNFVRIQKVINKFDEENKNRCVSFGGEIEENNVLVQISKEELNNFINE